MCTIPVVSRRHVSLVSSILSGSYNLLAFFSNLSPERGDLMDTPCLGLSVQGLSLPIHYLYLYLLQEEATLMTAKKEIDL